MSGTTAGEDPELLSESAMDTAMDTGSDAGEPGERNEVLTGPEGTDLPSDASFDIPIQDAELAAAIADDAPLPPEPGESQRDGGDQGDGLAPLFIEPDA